MRISDWSSDVCSSDLERWRLGGVDEGDQRIAGIIVSGGCADLHLLDHQRPVVVPHQVVDEDPHGFAQDHGVVALQERDGCAAHALRSSRSASTAAMTSAVRLAPRPSWARRDPLPRAMPRARAECAAPRRSLPPGPTSGAGARTAGAEWVNK